MSLTPEEAKARLASPANKLAGKAVALIREKGDPNELRELFKQGAGDVHWMRDPRHPRSRIISQYALAAAYEGQGDAVMEPKEEGESPATIARKLALFRVCVEAGCKPDENGWRGNLATHIIQSAFVKGASQDKIAYARLWLEIMGPRGQDINVIATRNYFWLGSRRKLDLLVSLGGDLKHPGLLDTAITYLGCAPSADESNTTRIEVIQEILLAGGRISPQGLERVCFEIGGTAYNARAILRQHPGVMGDLERAIDYKIQGGYQDVKRVSPDGNDSIFRYDDQVALLTALTQVRDILVAVVDDKKTGLDLRDEYYGQIRALNYARELEDKKAALDTAADFLARQRTRSLPPVINGLDVEAVIQDARETAVKRADEVQSIKP